MSQYYTGVGSRETPEHILGVMYRLAIYLAKKGMILRSGAADGADSAFESGCDFVNQLLKQIFLPWNGFSDRKGNEPGVILKIATGVAAAAQNLAEQIHPAWERLGQGAKTLHTRNVYQVLGPAMDQPSKFLVCYATLDKNGQPKGGTRTAIKLAEKFGIKVYNLYVKEDLEHIEKLLESVGI